MRQLIVLSLLVFSLATASDLTTQIRNLQVITEDYPPLNYLQDGDLTGLSVDILRLVYAELGVEFPKIDVMPWARGYHLAQSDRPVMLFTMSRSPAREPLFQWVGHTHSSYSLLFTFVGSGIESYHPRAQHSERVVAIQSDISQYAMEELGYPKEKLDLVDSPETLFNLVIRKRSRLFSLSEAPYRNLLKQADAHGLALRLLATTRETQGHYAFSQAVPEAVVTAFQNALDQVRPQQKVILERYQVPY